MGFLTRLFGGNKRNARLATWARSIPVSETQCVAMEVIWQAVQSKTPPADDPLGRLDADDLSYVSKICSSDFRPPEFGNVDVLRISAYRYLKDMGFSEREAAVGVGMMFNLVGRDDI